jgi:hypothetical protein
MRPPRALPTAHFDRNESHVTYGTGHWRPVHNNDLRLKDPFPENWQVRFQDDLARSRYLRATLWTRIKFGSRTYDVI